MMRGPRRSLVGGLAIASLSGVSLLVFVQGAVDFPAPTGPFVTGVHDFEFLDTAYPIIRPEDAGGRRLMARVWYPACRREDFEAANNTCNNSTDTMGRRRMFFEEGEMEAIATPMVDALKIFLPALEPIVAEMGAIETHSYVDAPPFTTSELATELLLAPPPVVVFNHGGLSYISQNTALMEEIASHGYTVFSLSHPGDSSGIQYPNGDTVRYDDEYLAAVLRGFTPDPDGLQSPDIQTRYEARRQYLQLPQSLQQERKLSSFLPRWRDDTLALVDYLESLSSSSNTNDILLGQLLQGVTSLQGLVAYMGMSFGGATAGSAAHLDTRAQGAVNIDGSHESLDVFGRTIRTPYLTFTSEPIDISPYRNEFFFEPLVSMGTNENITRVHIPNVTHYELGDLMFVSQADRQMLPGGGLGDGRRIHETLVSFCLGFLDTHLGRGGNWTPATSFGSFPETRSVDVTYVREWAREAGLNTSTTPSMAPTATVSPTSSPAESPSETSSSAPTATVSPTSSPAESPSETSSSACATDYLTVIVAYAVGVVMLATQT